MSNDDYFFEAVRDCLGVQLPVEVWDDLELKVMNLARAEFPAGIAVEQDLSAVLTAPMEAPLETTETELLHRVACVLRWQRKLAGFLPRMLERQHLLGEPSRSVGRQYWLNVSSRLRAGHDALGPPGRV